MDGVKFVNDKSCIEQVQQIMETTPEFDIVYERGAYVLDVDVNDDVYVNDVRQKVESDSGSSFPVVCKEYWERALNQAQQDHERKQSIQQDVHRENQKTFEQVKVKVPPKPYTSPRKRNVSPMRPHIVFSVHGLRFASRPRALTESTLHSWWTRNTFL